MSEKERLFSIGGLSKLTGVHVRCLRYYEKLGILCPAYVDADSGYRYYTFFHMRIVEAIQYCVELDIPLKEFHQFISEESGHIDYAALVAYGNRITEEKLQKILGRRRFLERLEKEMVRADDYGRSNFARCTLPENYCYCIPYEGSQTGEGFHSAMYRLIDQVEKSGLRAGYDNGMLLLAEGGEQKTYLFINIRDAGPELLGHPAVIRIPAGEFLCTVSGESHICRAPEIFCRQFARPGKQVVIEAELLTEQYHYRRPVFELRCLLTAKE